MVKKLIVLLSLSTVFLTGCVKYSANSLPITSLGIPAEKPSIAFQVKTRTVGTEYNSGTTINVVTNSYEVNESIKLNNFYKQSLEATNQFRSVRRGGEYADADIHVEFTFLSEMNDLATTSIKVTTYTLGILPGYFKDHLTLKAKVENRHTGKTNEFYIHEHINNAMWLPLILAAPFAGPGVEDEVKSRMVKNAVFKMKEDGFIQ